MIVKLGTPTCPPEFRQINLVLDIPVSRYTGTEIII